MMFLTHCMMGLTLLTVLSLCLPVWSALKVIQPYKVVTDSGTALVRCFIQPQPSNDQSPPYPYFEPEEVRLTLLKGLHGTEELCSSIYNFTQDRVTGVVKDREMQCSAKMREGAVEVTVSGLKSTDTDLYRCEIEVFYPPPYLRLTGNGTLIHVLGSSDCSVQGARIGIANRSDEEEDDEGDERTATASIPMVVLVMLVTFVLIVIIYFQTRQCQRGEREIVRQVPGGAYKVDAVPFTCENMA
ncbi:cytotoxic T-lymphocyte protein 4 [Xiphias gladius]|uniref:cytotoxic T-lymphocyte protein 4 n=1 Tax=Xiphias gladius TaxID=8245 RepID=UPI001A995F0D|nr:cytotoxic T-lymphocyte protein 4 [Xiphias gladius]